MFSKSTNEVPMRGKAEETRNSRSSLRVLRTILIILSMATLLAQPRAVRPPTPGTLSGAVRDESGAAVNAFVTISTNGFEQRAITRPDGTFQFLNLRPARYFLCAKPAPLLVKPGDDPFVEIRWKSGGNPGRTEIYHVSALFGGFWKSRHDKFRKGPSVPDFP